MGLEKLAGQDNTPRDKSYRFRILGQELIIHTDKSTEYLESLIKFIESKASEIREPSFLKKVLLLLLEISDEFFTEREKLAKETMKWEKRIDSLIASLPE
ncbi:cell division protein ZapA [Candidatus Calescamantes bacterium]|nr:cell division protein ZapA [Candidatus Calescamantes bacterium]